ncbi:hypothetical protein BURMUCGD2M_5629 [Burkholderia multivorans CGD2M]|uniref:Uncharacterized protein n=1 Tax=Burkholderia multivorans CGD2 TaxID=513052 RepID=B9BKN0_9BURK|nr:hypothetical protein BURMUCGD2_5638 [Burkholderia multivorans CGD2]EEE16184.1 hypothetical protein BURMUCGD2M_5629 [Burkholderia multivorans CGD2M]
MPIAGKMVAQKNGASSFTRDYRLREMNPNHENAHDLNRADFDLFV